MIKREISNRCLELSKKYPVLTITGPRQSGKTTLARALFSEKSYVNLENPDQRALAIEDPRSFLSNYPDGAIFDEIQRAPDLVSYIQHIVDESNANGQFILTGSQQFEISGQISQSLSGRTALIKLLPLSLKEIKSKQPIDIDDLLIKGFYPGLHDKNIAASDFFMNYFETYVQRDVRQLSNIENLQNFEKLVHLLAGRVGQLLNYNNLADDLGVSQPTIKNWLTVLQASYVIFLLPPFYKKINKRLIKTPKLYFYDVGLASYLLGIENINHLKLHPLRGNLFENFVVIDFLKKRLNQVKRSNLYFYRDRSGHEVDLLLEEALTLQAIEIKSAATANKDFSKGLEKLELILKNQVKSKWIIYNGDEEYSFNNCKLIPAGATDEYY